jgi:tRNA threonylcarbamoyladenosine biosynthesis protein TsaE
VHRVTSALPAAVRVRTAGADATEAVGAALASVLAPGAVVGLAGPLGAGKTCFVRGMATELGIDPALISSPTFVYLVDYPGRGIALYHADLYRLAEMPAEAAEAAYEGIGLGAAFAAGGIAVVEWWDCYCGPPPESLVRVEFVIENAEHRQLTVVFEGSHASDRAAAFSSKLSAAGLTKHG